MRAAGYKHCVDGAPGPLKIITQKNRAITFDKTLASGDVAIYMRNGVALSVTKNMLAIAGEYEETGVEPFRGQVLCEPMRNGKAKPYNSGKDYGKRGPRR